MSVRDEEKSKEQLLAELCTLREQVVRLEAGEIQRQHTEEALRVAKEHAETIISSSLDMIIAVDEHRRITEFNTAAEKVFGYRKAEVLGQSVDILYENPAQGEHIYERVLATGGGTAEVRNKTKDGKPFDACLKASVLRNGKGYVVGLMGILRDVSERKHTHEVQARLTAILEGTTDCVGISIPGGRMVYLNRAGRRLLGISEEEALSGINVLHFHPEWVRIQLSEIVPTLIRNGQWSGETAILTRDGREIPVSQTIIAHKDSDGLVQFFSTIIRDISTQKETESALRESEEKYRDLVENISEMIYIVDTGGMVIYVSPVVTSIGAYTPEEVVGRPFAEFIHPDDLSGLMEDFQRTIAGELRPSEFRVRKKSGQFLWGRSASRPIIRNGEVLGLRGVLTDVSENKRVEEALRESEQRYRNLFENANDAIATFTLDSVLTSFNRGAERMLGWSREEVIGQHARELSTPASMRLAEERTLRFLAGDKPASSTFEAELIHKDGHIIPVEARTRAIRDRKGQPIGFQGSYRDISAKKTLERQRGDFLAMLAHDVKNPLAAILGYVDLLQQEAAGQSTSSEEEFVQRIRDNAQTTLSLITNYLDLARLEAGAFVLQKRLQPVDAILQRVVQQYAGVAQRHHVTITLDVVEKLPLVFSDAMALERVFSNLVRNALKFTPETGNVTVRAQRWSQVRETGENRHSPLPTHGHDDGVVVEVIDTGPGIAPGEIPFLFQKYRHTTPARNQDGSGLGLFIVKTFVEAHGGHVEVENTFGSGVCFRVILPTDSSPEGTIHS
jgi:PAS domain S-box-containing protein